MTREGDKADKDVMSRLIDRGEEALGRLGDLPGAGRLVQSMTAMRERMDDIQKRLVGLDAVEDRVRELERRVEELEGRAAAQAEPSGRRTQTAAARRTRAAVQKSAERQAPDAGDAAPGGGSSTT